MFYPVPIGLLLFLGLDKGVWVKGVAGAGITFLGLVLGSDDGDWVIETVEESSWGTLWDAMKVYEECYIVVTELFCRFPTNIKFLCITLLLHTE